jgi:hypothetical protein
MSQRYCCPNCHGNRRRFEVIRHLAQEIEKDPGTGLVEFAADELVTVMNGDRPELEVICKSCGYRAPELVFIKAGDNYAPPDPT